MITRQCVLNPRRYTGSTTPPDALEDMSRYGNDGAMTNVTWVQLPSGVWVMSFNGTTSEVAWSPAILLADDVPWTYEFWLYPTIQDPNTTLVGNLHVGGAWSRVRITSSNIQVYNDANVGAIWTVNVAMNVWTHLVITADGTDVNNMELFVNGATEGTQTLADSSQTFRVLGHTGNDSNEYDGYVGTALVRTYALTAAQIWDRFNSERTWYGR